MAPLEWRPACLSIRWRRLSWTRSWLALLLEHFCMLERPRYALNFRGSRACMQRLIRAFLRRMQIIPEEFESASRKERWFKFFVLVLGVVCILAITRVTSEWEEASTHDANSGAR